MENTFETIEKQLIDMAKKYLEEKGYVVITNEEADILKRQEDDLK